MHPSAPCQTWRGAGMQACEHDQHGLHDAKPRQAMRCRPAAAGARRIRSCCQSLAQPENPTFWPFATLPYLTPGGINDQQYVKLRSEAKAPFRLTRIIFLGGLAAGAALGLFIITGRLVAALQGAPALLKLLLGLCHGVAATADAVVWVAVLLLASTGLILQRLQGAHPPRAATPCRSWTAIFYLSPVPLPPFSAGGEGAPDLQETVQNFGINSAALAVLGFFVYRDVSAARRDQAVVEREEALARLQVQTGCHRLHLPACLPAFAS